MAAAALVHVGSHPSCASFWHAQRCSARRSALAKRSRPGRRAAAAWAAEGAAKEAPRRAASAPAVHSLRSFKSRLDAAQKYKK